jgi:ribonuclease R
MEKKPPRPRRRRKSKTTSLKTTEKRPKPASPAKTPLLSPRSQTDLMTGTLRLHARGFGFVVPDQPLRWPQDIFIPKHLTENAVDGDHVEVQVNMESRSEKGPEGKILAILKRGRSHLGGIIRMVDGKGQLVAHAPLLGVTKRVILHVESGLRPKIGDRVIMQVIEWGDKNSPTLCELSHIIGNIDDPSCDVDAAIEEFSLLNQFPEPVIEEAQAFGKTVSKKEMKARTDLTKITTITIDPETARDYDDALSISKTAKGGFQLGVHIADVAHYVPPASALDHEAFKRCNSTYFPGRCVPMLPEELSNELCSLKEKVVRLTVSVLMDFDHEGNLTRYEICRAAIKSAKRFSYEEAKLVLDGKKKSVHAPALREMVELCHLLKKKRSERGSIDFALPDLVIQIDEKGMPTGLKLVEYDITHQLVEEFMLKANEIVAKALADRGKTLLYRIHEEPAEENMEDFFAMARSLGFLLPEKPTPKDLQHLFNEAKKTAHAQQLSVGFIRSMKLAYYSPENMGHFGLSLEHYCHFTSPIRRYSDLIIQRLLFNEEGETVDIDAIALKCSEQERLSFKAESSVKLLKKYRLLNAYMKENPDKEYAAIVTRIKPFGLYFEIADLMLEGFLHISELENDYFIFDPRQEILMGKQSGKVHRVGEWIRVMPTAIDLILLECKWSLIGTQAQTEKTRSRKKRR